MQGAESSHTRARTTAGEARLCIIPLGLHGKKKNIATFFMT